MAGLHFNSEFCFCYNAFSSDETISLVKGCNDLKKLTKALQRHETSMAHMKNYIQCKELERNLIDERTVDFQIQNMNATEKKILVRHVRQVNVNSKIP